MIQPNTNKSDAADARAKADFIIDGAQDAQFALRIAKAIQLDPALLDGNAKVVAALAAHDEAAAVLEAVFEKFGKRYPKSHRAFIEARFKLLCG